MTEIRVPAMTDPAAIASEVANTQLQTALISQKVTDGFAAINSSLAGFTSEQKDQAARLEKLLQMIHEVQLKSTGLERLGSDLISMREEFRTWRAEHESANNKVADDVAQFKGALKGWAAIATLILMLASGLAYWGVSARFDQNLIIDGQQNDQIRALEKDVTELKATKGAR